MHAGAPDEPEARAVIVPSGEHDLTRRVMRGTFWVALSRWGTLLITWPTTILLARLLDPSDYGYLALVTVFTRFGRIVADGGMANTIVLGPSLSEEQYARLHGWSLSLFLGVGALIAIAAVPIEQLYDISGMRWVLLALTTTFLADGLMLVPIARMRRAVRFRELATIEGIRVLVEAATSIALALRGYGYWALVGGHLAGLTTQATLVIRSTQSWPARPTRHGLEEPLRNARSLLSASITSFAATSSDAWVGGAVTGAVGLGGYSFMNSLARAPIEKISGIVSYASGSLIGNLHNDPARVGRTVLRLARVSVLLMFPIFAGIALVAEELVLGLLGEKWLPYTNALRLLCLFAMTQPIHSALEQAAIATGRARTVAGNGGILLLLLPAAFFLLGSEYGATGLAAAWLVPMPIVMLRLLLTVRETTGTRLFDWLAAVRGPAFSVSAMAVAVVLVSSIGVVQNSVPLVRLAIMAATGVVAYTSLLSLVAREDLRWLIARIRRQ